MKQYLFLLLVLSAALLRGQPTPAPALRSNGEYARGAWGEVHAYLRRSAQVGPDSLFSFKPSPDVRSFGETLDHVAASERGYCQMALGEKPSGGGAGTGAKRMTDVTAAFQVAHDVCERAYAQSDVDLALPAYGGGRMSRLQILLANVSHDNEHYGNIVTYLRLNRLVPPSSQPSPR